MSCGSPFRKLGIFASLTSSAIRPQPALARPVSGGQGCRRHGASRPALRACNRPGTSLTSHSKPTLSEDPCENRGPWWTTSTWRDAEKDHYGYLPAQVSAERVVHETRAFPPPSHSMLAKPAACARDDDGFAGHMIGHDIVPPVDQADGAFFAKPGILSGRTTQSCLLSQ